MTEDNVTLLDGRRKRKELATVTEALGDTNFDADGTMRRQARPENQEWRERFLESFSADVQKQAKDHPEILDAVDAARNVLCEMLEAEAWRLVFEPPQRPVYQRGELVGFEPMVQTKHIQFMLERHIPERYHLATKTELMGGNGAGIKFQFVMGDAALELDAEDADIQELEDGEG